MLDQDLNLRYVTRQPWRLHRLFGVTFAWLVLLVFPSGCGFDGGTPRSVVPVAIIRGNDSAGATIELEKRGVELSRARVIDVVLGTGEAEIISDEDGNVEFTIPFPAGATITYVGTARPASASSTDQIAGIWRQHADGIFAEDEGTWSTPEDFPDS